MFFLCPLQKTLRDKEFESLQVKVQRLEKLCRALQIERNELSKKVQGVPEGTSAIKPETEAASQQEAVDSKESSPVHQSSSEAETPQAACSQACHCAPDLEAESHREVCSAQD